MTAPSVSYSRDLIGHRRKSWKYGEMGESYALVCLTVLGSILFNVVSSGELTYFLSLVSIAWLIKFTSEPFVWKIFMFKVGSVRRTTQDWQHVRTKTRARVVCHSHWHWRKKLDQVT